MSFKISNEDIQEEPQSQIIAHVWHQEEEQTNQDRQYTSHKPTNSKATSPIFPNKLIIGLGRIS